MPETIRAVCCYIGCAVHVPLAEVLYDVHMCVTNRGAVAVCVPLEKVLYVCH